MAWVLLPDENESQDKRVESGIVPCLDAGSTPASSTPKTECCLRGSRGILTRVLSPKGTINAQVHFSTPASSTSRDLRLYTIRDIVAHMNLRRDLALRLKHRFASVLIGSNITSEDC